MPKMSFDELVKFGKPIKARPRKTTWHLAQMALVAILVLATANRDVAGRETYTWNSVSYFTGLLREKPDDYKLHNQRAEAFIDVGYPQDARKDYSVSLTLRSDQPSVYANLARLDLREHKVESGKRNLWKALESWNSNSSDWQDTALYVSYSIDFLVSQNELHSAKEVVRIQSRLVELGSSGLHSCGLLSCGLARLEEYRGNKDEAKVLYQKALASTASERLRIVYVKLASFYERQKDYSKAIAIITDAFSKCPARDKVALLHIKSDLEFRSPDIQHKDGLMKDWLDILPERVGTDCLAGFAIELGDLRTRNRARFDQVSKEVKLRLQKHFSNPTLMLADSFVDGLCGRADLYRTKFARAVKLVPRPDRYFAWFARSHFDGRQSRFDEAFADMVETLKLTPPAGISAYLPQALAMLVLCNGKKDWPTIEANCNYVMLNFEASESLPEHLSRTLSIEQFQAASVHWVRLLSDHPENPCLLYLLGVADLYSRKDESAIRHLTKAIELKPRWQSLYLNRARGYRFMRRYKAAELDLTRAIEISGDKDAHLFVDRAEVFHELEKPIPGLKDVDHALELIDKKQLSSTFHPKLFRLKANFLSMLERYTEAKIWRAKFESSPDPKANW